MEPPTTEDLQVLADEIARAFRVEPITPARLADPGQLIASLQKAGAEVVKSARYGDSIDFADDARVFDENTVAAFWTSRSFLLAPPVSFTQGPFLDRCFVIPGPTTASEVLNAYYEHVQRDLFEDDALMLARSTGQLLIVTHYGTVVLLEPSPQAGGREEGGAAGAGR